MVFALALVFAPFEDLDADVSCDFEGFAVEGAPFESVFFSETVILFLLSDDLV